jgi:hypothetical protein
MYPNDSATLRNVDNLFEKSYNCLKVKAANCFLQKEVELKEQLFEP